MSQDACSGWILIYLISWNQNCKRIDELWGNLFYLSFLFQGSLISINSTCTEIGNFDNADVTGEIEFAIRYCFETRSLEICIQACKNLAYGEERKKKCNPWVPLSAFWRKMTGILILKFTWKVQNSQHNCNEKNQKVTRHTSGATVKSQSLRQCVLVGGQISRLVEQNQKSRHRPEHLREVTPSRGY